MFLFKPHHVPGIEDGTKTQTRRFHKQWRARVGSIHQVRTELFGKPHCHIQVIRRWVEKVGDISEEDAQAEGGYSKEEYIEGLLEMHGNKYTRESVVKCYEFLLVKICPDCGEPSALGHYQNWYCPRCDKSTGEIPTLVEKGWCRHIGLPVEGE